MTSSNNKEFYGLVALGSVSLHLFFDGTDKVGKCWTEFSTISREWKLWESIVRKVIRYLRKAGVIKTE